MLRSLIKCKVFRKHSSRTLVPKCTFLTNEYKCNEAWNVQISSPILTKVNLNDFYNILDQNFSSKGVISAIDVDIFANAVKDATYLDELKDLLHKLRLSAETGNTLESTHHATIRNYMEFGNIPELIQILKDPLNFGVFLDFYAANILLDKLITSQSYDLASNVASFIMLQEDFSNDITNTLCQYACYKYLSEYKNLESEPIVQEENKNKKKEEIKIRIKFLRNPYFDDHFDIQDLKTLSGKTLAWTSKNSQDNLSCNLQIIGWLFYKKYDKLLLLCNELIKTKPFKLCQEVVDLMNKEIVNQPDNETILNQCIDVLSKATITETKLEHSLKNSIENAINRTQNKDIAAQKELFARWELIREDKLEEQSKRLDRANRMENILKQQKQMEVEEQKLWFFENEEDIDLQIEEKEKLEDTSVKKSNKQKDDENYIPPEILPKRK